MLSRVSTLEEGKGGPRNDTEERAKIESALTSLHQRISELEKGNGRGGGAGCRPAPSASGTLPGALASFSESPAPSSPSPPSCPALPRMQPGLGFQWVSLAGPGPLGSGHLRGREAERGRDCSCPSSSPPHTLTHSQDFPKSHLLNLQ